MLTVQIEVDGRTLGGNELLIPFTYIWLGENSCRQLLAHVLAEQSSIINDPISLRQWRK